MSRAYCLGRQRGVDVFELPAWVDSDEEGRMADLEEVDFDPDVYLVDWEADHG
jgi:hypothetical protein